MASGRKVNQSYQDIVKVRLLRVIHTEARYKAVQKEITRLLTRGRRRPIEEDYLETLHLLIHNYEKEYGSADTTALGLGEGVEGRIEKAVSAKR
jgi:hypothetical protein